MDIIKLQHETFDAVRELTNIHTAIADGRTALESLKASTEDYLTGREKEAIGRIERVLIESRAALDEVGRNHEALTKYSVELRGYTELLRTLNGDLLAFAALLRERMAAADKKLDEKLAEINEATHDLKVIHANIVEDRKQLAREQAQINEERRLLKDQRKAFERAWGELTIKQSTN